MGKHLKHVLFVSGILLLFQSIVNTEIGIISQFTHQNGNTWAGPYANALLFLGTAVVAFYNSYLKKYQYKWIFFLSSLGYLGYVGFSILFLKIGFTNIVLIILLLGSFICGVIVSALYNAQFNYINNCSILDKEPTKYFGFNLGIVMSANLLGNSISAILIGPLGQFGYALVMQGAILVLSILFLKVKSLPAITNEVVQQNNSHLLKQSNSNPQKDDTVSNNDSSPFSLCACYSLSGVILSFVYVQISVLMYRTYTSMDPIQLNRLTFIVFIFEGVGQLLGGIFIIFISPKIKSLIKQITVISNIFLIATILIYIGSYLQNIILICFGVFIVGMCDSIIFALCLSVAGIWKQKGIGVFNMFQCGTVGISVIVLLYTNFQVMIFWILIIHFLSTISLLGSNKVK